ncbi:MAG: hypothetical protein JWR67_1789 [Mucilaginibacter sp.]|nr:hypothetical protein [Mucilaginibacter sp.]
MESRIMYIERKDSDIDITGEAKIGVFTFQKPVGLYII